MVCAVTKVLRDIDRLSDEHERDSFPVIYEVPNSYWVATSLNILYMSVSSITSATTKFTCRAQSSKCFAL